MLLLTAVSAAPKTSGNALGSFLPILLILALGFFMIRSQRARQKAASQMTATLVPGVDVMTTGGLHATVVTVDDATVELEIAPGVVCRYAKAAVARVLTPAASVDDADDTTASGAVVDADASQTSGDSPTG